MPHQFLKSRQVHPVTQAGQGEQPSKAVQTWRLDACLIGSPSDYCTQAIVERRLPGSVCHNGPPIAHCWRYLQIARRVWRPTWTIRPLPPFLFAPIPPCQLRRSHRCLATRLRWLGSRCLQGTGARPGRAQPQSNKSAVFSWQQP